VCRQGATRGYGMRGKALKLSGPESCVMVPALGELPDLTVAMWLNPHVIEGGASGLLCGEGQVPGMLGLTINANGEVGCGIGGMPVQLSKYRFTPDTIGEWHHLAVSYDRAARAVGFYIDGKPDVTRSLADAPVLVLKSPLRLGGAGGGARGFNGELDEFRVYAKPLSADEVASLATRPALTPIAMAYNFQDGTAVRLLGKTVTLAPGNPLTLERATDYFYISEPDGSAGIRVQDGRYKPDGAQVGVQISMEGVMRTKPSGGGRFLELSAPPTTGASRAVLPSVTKPPELAAAAGRLVKITGNVRSMAADGTSFMLAEPGGAGPEVKVAVERSAPVKKPAAGFTVAVEGVVGLEANRPVVMLRDLEQLNPPPSPAVAFYLFDEESGDRARDSSPNKLDARLVGGVQRVPGRLGRALRLDGATGHVQMPDLGVPRNLTIAAWVNLASYGKDPFASSILHSDGWNLGALHFMVLRENGHLRAGLNGIGDLDSKFAFTDAQLGKWVHVALTYDANHRKLQCYVNGQPDSSGGVATPRPVDLSHARIATWEGHARMWDGMMDDFRIYDQALDPSEISKLARGESATK